MPALTLLQYYCKLFESVNNNCENLQSSLLYVISDLLDSLGVFLVKRIRFNSVASWINSPRWRQEPCSCRGGNLSRKSLKARASFCNFPEVRANLHRCRHVGYIFVPSFSQPIVLTRVAGVGGVGGDGGLGGAYLVSRNIAEIQLSP